MYHTPEDISINKYDLTGENIQGKTWVADETSSGNFFKDSWFNKNQYFSAEAAIRVGTYIDLGFKKILDITIGEYREVGYKANYTNDKGSVNKIDNHLFEFAVSAAIGVSIKYDIAKGSFDSVSGSYFGFGGEISNQNYGYQLFLGFETGVHAGVGVGGNANVRGGCNFNF